MSSVIPDTVSPSFFIFSAAISACLTSSISSQVRSSYSDGRPFWKSLSSLHPGCRTFLPHLLRGIILLNSSVPFPHLLCSTQQYHKGLRKSREKKLFMILHIKYLKSYGLSYMASSCFDMRDNTFAKSSVTGRIL